MFSGTIGYRLSNRKTRLNRYGKGCGVHDYGNKNGTIIHLKDCARRIKNDINCTNTFYYGPESGKCLCQKVRTHCPRKPSYYTCEYVLESSK